MPMELILREKVDKLGEAGELVSVKSGYGRNYLLPRGLAVIATSRNKAQLEHERRIIAAQQAKLTQEAKGQADRLNAMTLQFERLVGEDDKLFGSVTTRDITDQLEKAGIVLDHRKVLLKDAIKALGKYEVDVKVGAGVTAKLKFWVVGKTKED
jgi:large subunit ribosomal protein L9